MNKMNKIQFFFSIFAVSSVLLCSGCKNNVSTQENNNTNTTEAFKYTTLNIISPYQTESSTVDTKTRQALPAIDEDILSRLSFKVVAIDNNSKQPKEKDDSDFFTKLESEAGTFIYKIKLSPGIWKLMLSGMLDNNEEKLILSGEKTITVRSNGSYYEDINVNFISKSTGNIDLQIDVTAVPDIKALNISDSGNSNLNGKYSVTETKDSNGIVTKRIINIKPTNAITYGTHHPILEFRNSDGETYTTIISIPEQITVRQNMTTKYWYNSGANPFLTETDGNGHALFIITPELISEVVNTIFYVNGSKGKDTDSGNSFSKPLKSIQAAFNRIDINNHNDFLQNKKRNFYIYIDEKAAAPGTDGELKASNPLNLKIFSIGSTKPTISSDFNVGKNINLELNNFTFSGAFTCDKDSTVTASDINFSRAVTVGHAQAANDQNENKASLTLTNCTVTGLVNCYGNSGTETTTDRCTLTAQNCTFKNSVTIDNGIITANSTNFDKNFIGKNNSKTVLTADEYLHNTIKGLVTFSETSSASFKNIDIDYTGTSSNSITLEGTSSLVIENAVINKNIDTTTGTNITFVGNTHFKDNSTLPKSFVLKQKNNVILKLKNIPAYTGTDTGNSKLAAIELENPSYNLVVMEGAEGQDLTQEIVERFEIHNPGYYLAFDSQSKKGVVKLSSIKIEEPTFGGCSIEINGNISFGQNGIGLLGRADTDQEIRVTARDSDGNALNVTSVKQYLGATMISDATETPETEKTIQFKRSELETYGLEIRFMYKQIEYGTMLTVKIQ